MLSPKACAAFLTASAPFSRLVQEGMMCMLAACREVAGGVGAREGDATSCPPLDPDDCLLSGELGDWARDDEPAKAATAGGCGVPGASAVAPHRETRTR